MKNPKKGWNLCERRANGEKGEEEERMVEITGSEGSLVEEGRALGL